MTKTESCPLNLDYEDVYQVRLDVKAIRREGGRIRRRRVAGAVMSAAAVGGIAAGATVLHPLTSVSQAPAAGVLTKTGLATPTSAANRESVAPSSTAPSTSVPSQVDPLKLFDYAAVVSAYGAGDDTDLKFRTRLPVSVARDAVTVLHAVDPSLTHARVVKAASAHVAIVPDGSDTNLHQMSLASAWTVDGIAPADNTYTLGGYLQIDFGDSHAMLGAPGHPQRSNQPCGIEPANLAITGRTDPNSPWTPCSVRTLGDGSTVSTSSSKRGAGTITFAIREFPGGRGGIAVTAIDFPLVLPPAGGEPDAAHVLTPSPWNEQSLAAALSGLDLSPGL